MIDFVRLYFCFSSSARGHVQLLTAKLFSED